MPFPECLRDTSQAISAFDSKLAMGILDRLCELQKTMGHAVLFTLAGLTQECGVCETDL